MFPGKLWVGLTEGWFGDFPNPLEVDGGIRDCIKKAQELGLGTQKVFEAGHSLGGIVLETWAKDNADLSTGIILYDPICLMDSGEMVTPMYFRFRFLLPWEVLTEELCHMSPERQGNQATQLWKENSQFL